MATNNNFTVTGFVAMDANVVKNNNGSAFARFPLSIRTTKKDKDGNEKKISALQNIEVATKADSPKLDLLKKGTLVKVEGFFEVNQYPPEGTGNYHLRTTVNCASRYAVMQIFSGLSSSCPVCHFHLMGLAEFSMESFSLQR